MRNGDSYNAGGYCVMRRLFTIASALSLIMCVAMGALWESDARYYRLTNDWTINSQIEPYPFGWTFSFKLSTPSEVHQQVRVGSTATPVAFSILRQCGYDLRASKHRCPECGTRFFNTESTLS